MSKIDKLQANKGDVFPDELSFHHPVCDAI